MRRRANLATDVQSIAIGQHDVQQHDGERMVGRSREQPVDSRYCRFGVHNHKIVLRQVNRKHFSEALVVFYDQDELRQD